MKILIMGLPGSGKTWLAERLQKHLDCAWYNADAIRKMANDWDFSEESRLRQAGRMMTLANYEKSHGRTVICDFVCPTNLTRNIFHADVTIWMDTIESGRFEDTNKIFEVPDKVEWRVQDWMSDEKIASFSKDLRIQCHV
jgi:adenylylsulfate kinase